MQEGQGEGVVRGMSSARDAEAVAQDLARQLIHPHLGFVLFFCSAEYDLPALAAALEQYFGGIELVGCTTAGEIKVLRDIDNDVRGRDILLIDDILESGNTLKYTRDLMLSRGAASVHIAVLLDKHMRRKADIDPDFVGFDCPDHFVVGYGMDVAHAFRELPFVGIVKGDA